MQDCKPVGMPVNVSLKLAKATDNDDSIDQREYQSAIGSLIYLSVSMTRNFLCNEQIGTIFIKTHECTLKSLKASVSLFERTLWNSLY